MPGFDDQVKLTADLTAFPSSRAPRSDAQDFMAEHYGDRGLSVDRWQIKIDDLEHLPGYSPHSQDSYDDASNVVGVHRPKAVDRGAAR